MPAQSVIAVDLGATSGRVVLATLADGRTDLAEVHRFSTAAHPTGDGLRLDVHALFAEIQRGIGLAVDAATAPVASLGIDCWAVDYGLLGDDGLLELPFNYRDERTARGLALVRDKISYEELYGRTGLQDIPFNTINQLADDLAAGRLDRATRFLMLPDLLAYWLTGRAVAERTNASTTALLDPRTGEWDWELIDRLGLPRRIFPEVVEAGTVVGEITTGPATGVPLVAVGTHDTASAVVGAPLRTDDAFISSGTWSLVGMELPGPILTDASREASLTNEGGVDGTVRYLKNVMGLWILSESIRTWAKDGRHFEVPELIEAARAIDDAPRFDATHPSLLPPGDMPARVKALAGGDDRLDDPAVLTRALIESLADAYRDVVEELASITGRAPGRIVIVGGGSQNRLLCQRTADRTGLPVSAGPVEATALGNCLVQARAVGILDGTLTDLRKHVMASSNVTQYLPRPDEKLAAITALSNEFGANPSFARAGGGNSSAKDDGVLWIKPSGVSMATLEAEDLVPLDLQILLDSLDAPDPDPSFGDPVNHIATLARRDDGPRRPSVEILFHALIPETYVLHSHPLLINAITCNADGEALAHAMFGDDVLWVPYVDPGLPLAREVKARREAYVTRTGGPAPAATFLMNHGLIVSGDDPEAVRLESYRILRAIERAVADAARPEPAPEPDTDALEEVAEAFRLALGAEAAAADGGDIARGFPTTSAGARFLVEGPLIPDQIVYAGSFPLVVSGKDVIDARLAEFRTARGIDPVVAVVPGVGVVAAGDDIKSATTALQVYVDALTVGQAATALGSVRALDERERRFIETWEAEAYRKQVAKS